MASRAGKSFERTAWNICRVGSLPPSKEVPCRELEEPPLIIAAKISSPSKLSQKGGRACCRRVIVGSAVTGPFLSLGQTPTAPRLREPAAQPLARRPRAHRMSNDAALCHLPVRAVPRGSAQQVRVWPEAGASVRGVLGDGPRGKLGWRLQTRRGQGTISAR